MMRQWLKILVLVLALLFPDGDGVSKGGWATE